MPLPLLLSCPGLGGGGCKAAVEPTAGGLREDAQDEHSSVGVQVLTLLGCLPSDMAVGRYGNSFTIPTYSHR